MKTRYAIWDGRSDRKGEFTFLCHCQANWSKNLEKTKVELADLRESILEDYSEEDKIKYAENMRQDLEYFDKNVKILCLQIETVNDKWKKEQKAAIARSTPINGGWL